MKNNSNLLQTTEELKERSLNHIDFNGIRTLLANKTTSEISKKLAIKLNPSTDPSTIKTLLEETSEGRLLINEKNIPQLNGLENISELLKIIKLGGVLNGLEVLKIASSLEILNDLKETIIESSYDLIHLKKYAHEIINLTRIANSIKSQIENDGAIKNSATLELSAIRSQVRNNYNKVTNKLSDMISSSAFEGVIQDNVISVRGDRLVIQVKTNMQNEIPGVIHGASNTGMTQFIEPLETIALCNTWRKSTLEEELEIKRILTTISNDIGEYSDSITSSLIAAVDLDLIISKSKLSNEIKANTEIISDSFTFNNLTLISSVHPLLEKNSKPLTLQLSQEHKVLVITGPNTGGKTVALKTVGLLAAMQQSGIHITGQPGTHIPIFDGIYADIGDQQSIEGSVSTFSSHIETLKTIIDVATPQSLVLLDEIGSSTNPEEGAAIGSAILEYFAKENITTIATTHHSLIVFTAENNNKMKNASFHLDPDTLSPTYELQEGISGRSYALSIASNLGLPDKIVQRAIENLSPETREINTQLEDINRERKKLAEALDKSHKYAQDHKSARDRLELEIEYLINHKTQIFTEVRLKAKEQFKYLTDLVSKAKSTLSWSKGGEINSNLDDKKKALSEISNEMKKVAIPKMSNQNLINNNLKPGDIVSIKDIASTGKLHSINNNDTAIVKVGNSNLRIDLSRLSSTNITPLEFSNKDQKYHTEKSIVPGQDTLDIRGDDVETSISKIDLFLNDAITSNLSKVTIIHGKGTGILRKSIRQNLSSHTLVDKFEPKLDSTGGDGATTIFLV